MGTIADKLSYLNNTKQAIKTSLENKGKDTTGKTFREYAGLIDNIEAGGAIEPFITDASYLFTQNTRLNNLEQLLDLISTDCNDMSYMFYGCHALTSLDLSNLDTTNVTNMSYMFYNCSALTSLDLSNLDTANVTDMLRMFFNCKALTSLDLSNFDTANVTDMSRMFRDCRALTSLDLSNFDTTNVTTMSSMFYSCYALTSLDLSSLNTTNVTDMSYMFNNCTALTSLDLSNFNTANVTTMLNMFNNCTALTSLDLSNFNTANVTTMLGMFNNCIYIDSIIGIDFNNVYNVSNMFRDCMRLAILTFKPGGSFGGAETNTASTLTLDLSGTAMDKTSILNMINSCSSNLSGRARIFKFKAAAFSTLTTDDIALFTDKNYSVISA